MKKLLLFLSVIVALNLHAFDLNKVINKAQEISSSSNSGDYKSLLNKALQSAVDDLSKNGYLNNAVAEIELPATLKTAANLASKVGGEKYATELTKSINEAATKAVGGASKVFAQTISNMSEDDIKSLFSSSDNALTNYLQTHANDELSAVFKPIIEEMMSKNSFATAYNTLNSYVKDNALTKSQVATNLKDIASNLGLSDGANDGDLNDYITRKSLDGLFNLMSEKESNLRNTSVKSIINKFK
ncbi:hypothetical protein LMG7974_00823 [Campylobacter majalis]|uniref:DUF4197 domain-containing protein n=1 Tax=Campylobacter majalis TaxID=2790656 RepID=A0ABM8Q5K2_9BACT|nr:DUF4197 domain-containing protein [Campylobacter majalis]CAD7288081.1 hypothetical protein LMG7974_00823 [Campylobacter majalis]